MFSVYPWSLDLLTTLTPRNNKGRPEASMNCVPEAVTKPVFPSPGESWLLDRDSADLYEVNGKISIIRIRRDKVA